MNEPTLFDAELAKEIAIAKVEVNADSLWKARALEAVRLVASRNQLFTPSLSPPVFHLLTQSLVSVSVSGGWMRMR